MSQIGLIIGRFQPLHSGHLLLIDTSLKKNPATLMLIGSIDKVDSSNPLSYELRKSIICLERPNKNIFLGGLLDFPNDDDWIKQVLSYIPKNVKTCNIYCGDKTNDSAIKSLQKSKLPFHVNIVEIPRSIIPISASYIREKFTKNKPQELEEFLGKETINILKEKL